MSHTPPTVVTHDPTNVGTTSATINGEVTAMGDAPEYIGFFAIRVSGGSWQGTSGYQLSQPASWSINISGLQEGYSYDYAAIAQYDYGGSTYQEWGNIVTFTALELHDYEHGSGTEQDPYQIWNEDDLDGVRGYLDKHFIQKAALDLTEFDPWIPFGTFSGVYDGGNFLIYNVDVDVVAHGNKERAGLFSLVNGGKLKNIRVHGTFYGAKYVGALTGMLVNGEVDNCHSTGEITGQEYVGGLLGYSQASNCYNSGSGCKVTGEHVSDDYISIAYFGGYGNVYTAEVESRLCGGFVGGVQASPSEFKNCYAKGDVKCGDSEQELENYYGAYVGGFWGQAFHVKIDSCYAKGDAKGSFAIGGFGGICEDVEISNCYSMGSVTPHRDADLYLHLEGEPSLRLLRALGGFMGRFQDPAGTTEYEHFAKHCYSTGFVHTMDSLANQSGGFTYSPGNKVVGENNYYDKETAQQTDTTLATPKTTAEMVYPYSDPENVYINWAFYGEDPDPVWVHDRGGQK